MKYNLSTIIEKIKNTGSLTTAEREKMRHVISEYTAMKPLSKGDANLRQGSVFAPLYVFFRKPVALALVVLLLLSGGGVSYAAEGAVPGDILYGIKVDVNEKIAVAFAVSPEAKADVNARLAEKRLEEAADLATRGKLDQKTADEISVRFEASADLATNAVESLEGEDAPAAIDIASSFESKLSAHETVLADIDGNSKVANLKNAIRVKALRVSQIRSRAEGDVAVSKAEVVEPAVAAISLKASEDTAPTAREASDGKSSARMDVVERMKTAATLSLKTTTVLYERVKGKLKIEEERRVEAELKADRKLMTDGDVAFKNGDMASAFHAYQKSLVSTGKLMVFLKAFVRLDVKVFERPTIQLEKVELDEKEDPPSSLRISSFDDDVKVESETKTDTNLEDNVKVESEGDIKVELGL